MNFSYYFPESTNKFPEYFDGDKSPFFVPIMMCIGEGFDNNRAISDVHTVLSQIADKNGISMANLSDSLMDYLHRVDLYSLRERFEKVFEDMMREIAIAAYNKTDAHEPSKPSANCIFGFPEVELREELYAKIMEHLKGAAVSGVGLIIGGSGGKAVNRRVRAVGGGTNFLERTADRKVPGVMRQTGADFMRGAGARAGHQGIGYASLTDSANYFYIVAGSDIQSESFMPVDTVTDFVPIEGSVKNANDFGYNMICVGKGCFANRNAKMALKEINKQIRAINKDIYQAIRMDFQRFTYNPDILSELAYELSPSDFMRKIIHGDFNNPSIYRNKAVFADYLLHWINGLYEDVKQLFDTIKIARNNTDDALQELHNAEENLSNLEYRRPYNDDPEDEQESYYDEYRKFVQIKEEKQYNYETALRAYNDIEYQSKDQITYFVNILYHLNII